MAVEASPPHSQDQRFGQQMEHNSGCLVSKHASQLLRIVVRLLEDLTSADGNGDGSGAGGAQGMKLPKGSLVHLAALISDPSYLYKFYFKARMNEDLTFELIKADFQWRLYKKGVSFDGLEGLSEKARYYLNCGIFRFHGQDRAGRPTLLINIAKYNAAEGKSHIAEFKECLVFVLEVARRCIYAVNDALVKSSCSKASNSSILALDEIDGVSDSSFSCNVSSQEWIVDVSKPALIHQLSVILDLEGVGLSNVNYEMMPVLFDLFKSHYPGIFGTLFVLNFGWLHSGMWSIVKTALSAEACKKLLFLTKREMSDHFDPQFLLEEHGGLQPLIELKSNSIFQKYGVDLSFSSPPSPHQTKTLELIHSKLDIPVFFPNDVSLAAAVLPQATSTPALSTSIRRPRIPSFTRMSPHLKATSVSASPFLAGTNTASEGFFTPRLPANSPMVFASPSMDVWFDAPEELESFLLSPAALLPMRPRLDYPGTRSASEGRSEDPSHSMEVWSPGMVAKLGIGEGGGGATLDILELPESAVEAGSTAGSRSTAVEEGDDEADEDEDGRHLFNGSDSAVGTPSSVFGGRLEESIGLSRDVELQRRRGSNGPSVATRRKRSSMAQRPQPDGWEDAICEGCCCCRKRGRQQHGSHSRSTMTSMLGTIKKVVVSPWTVSLGIAQFLVNHGPFGEKVCKRCQDRNGVQKRAPSAAGSTSLSVRLLAGAVLVSGMVALLRWYRVFARSPETVKAQLQSVAAMFQRSGLEQIGNWIVEHLFG
ncbi:hypothetical protein CcCBS67573_g01048 [Chytriomyces confervae]|uniref:CRAL-TRIO domain-containing protein n=1 Tax=Chytriomyces confervae TaxID=246404 RepID=A0A507FN75_9FUNG|nr:hypothetical protein CcCBS67573_g01048 [Chytriomyces confervae]